MALSEATLKKIGKTVEQYMLATGEIRRYQEDTDATVDPVTLELISTYVVIYTGKCMVSPMGNASQQDRGGSIAVTANTYEIGLPLDSGTPQANDIFLVTAGLDPMLVGRSLRILGVMPATFATHRRLSAELLTDSA